MRTVLRSLVMTSFSLPAARRGSRRFRRALNSGGMSGVPVVISRTYSQNRETVATRGRDDVLHQPPKGVHLFFRFLPGKESQNEKARRTKHDCRNQHIDFKHVNHDLPPTLRGMRVSQHQQSVPVLPPMESRE